MPKSPEEMFAAIVRNLAKKTGKSLDEWMQTSIVTPETL